jgi:hypothetical protein
MRNIAFALLLAVPAAYGQSVFVGETEIPLGVDAFAAQAECLNAGGCGTNIGYLGPPPSYPIYSLASGLTADHILEVVPTDLGNADVVRLDFAVPIQNADGPDLYLGQAEYFGDLSKLDTVKVNDFEVSLDNVSWTTFQASGFVRDSVVSTQYIYYSDPEIKSDAYQLWYATVDIGDLGVAPGEAVSTLYIRGPDLSGLPETVSLDAVTVANLNQREFNPEIVITSPSDGTVVSGSVTVAATAFDIDVFRVLIFARSAAGGRFICVDATVPYACAWDTTQTPNGVYRLIVTAIDTAGARWRDTIRVLAFNPAAQ